MNGTLVRTQAVATIIKRVFRAVSIVGTSVIEGNTGVTNADDNLFMSGSRKFHHNLVNWLSRKRIRILNKIMKAVPPCRLAIRTV
jgi:hypothetical protein